MSETWIPCQGRNCDNRASGVWLVVRHDGVARLAKLCASCGMHDVLHGQRSVGTRQHPIWSPTFAHRQPLRVKLLSTYAADCSGIEAVQRHADGAKHWVDSKPPKPIDKSHGYTITRIVDQKPFKPFVFEPRNK